MAFKVHSYAAVPHATETPEKKSEAIPMRTSPVRQPVLALLDHNKQVASPMAIAYALDHERRRVYTHAQGLLTYAELSTHFNAKMRDERAGCDELFDATAADTNLTAEQVHSLFLYALQMFEKGPVGATGIVATNPVVFGMARMYATLCQQVGVTVQVFRTVTEAEQWLDACLETRR